MHPPLAHQALNGDGLKGPRAMLYHLDTGVFDQCQLPKTNACGDLLGDPSILHEPNPADLMGQRLLLVHCVRHPLRRRALVGRSGLRWAIAQLHSLELQPRDGLQFEHECLEQALSKAMGTSTMAAAKMCPNARMSLFADCFSNIVDRFERLRLDVLQPVQQVHHEADVELPNALDLVMSFDTNCRTQRSAIAHELLGLLHLAAISFYRQSVQVARQNDPFVEGPQTAKTAAEVCKFCKLCSASAHVLLQQPRYRKSAK